MEITDIKIFKATKKGALLAYANVILNERFIIRGIRLLQTEKSGRFIIMPTRRTKENRYRDICHPLNSNVRTELTEAIFAAYDEEMKTEK